MKTKELIQKLQEVDPEGECHLDIDGGLVIFDVYREAGYWDGNYPIVEYDDEGEPTRYISSCKDYKVVLRTTDLESMIFNNPELEIVADYSGYIEPKRLEDRFYSRIEKLRKKVLKRKEQIRLARDKRVEERRLNNVE